MRADDSLKAPGAGSANNPAKAPPEDSMRLLRRLLQENLRPQARRYMVAGVFMILAASATAAWAWLQKDLVNEIFFKRDATRLLPLTFGIILLPFLKGLAGYGQDVILSRIGNRIVADVQRRVYAHVLSFGLEFFTSRPSSKLIARVSGGARAVREVLNLLVLSCGRDLLTLVALTAVMVLQAPVLFVIALVIGPLIVFAMTRLVRRVRRQMSMEFALNTQTLQLLQETAHGARVLKAFNLATYMNTKMADTTAAIEARANKTAALQARAGPILEAIGGAALGLITLYCGWLTIYGHQQPGVFVSFSAALLLAYEPAKRLARLRVNLEVDLVGVRQLYRLLDRPSDMTEADDAPQLKVTAGDVEFRNVDFSYRPEMPVLKGVNLRFARNTKTAIVGPSGAGKTTMLSLIPRFYEVESGAILVDGQDIRKFSSTSLRQHIAVVNQDTFLFNGSIRDNIRIGREGASEEAVRAAAMDAFADEFISAMPDGYDTDVGENGAQLSGGQRQRIAIARALLKDAPILLLDEATSSLDSHSEQRVQLGLDRLMEGRTTIVVAHRLSTVVNADRIVVLDGAEVVEQGNHAELVALGGLYAQLYMHQFADLPRQRPYAAEQPLSQ